MAGDWRPSAMGRCQIQIERVANAAKVQQLLQSACRHTQVAPDGRDNSVRIIILFYRPFAPARTHRLKTALGTGRNFQSETSAIQTTGKEERASERE